MKTFTARIITLRCENEWNFTLALSYRYHHLHRQSVELSVASKIFPTKEAASRSPLHAICSRRWKVQTVSNGLCN